MPNNKSLTTICKASNSSLPIAVISEPSMYKSYADYMLSEHQKNAIALSHPMTHLSDIHDPHEDMGFDSKMTLNKLTKFRLLRPDNIFTSVKCPTFYAGARYNTPRLYGVMPHHAPGWNRIIYSYTGSFTSEDLYEQLACHDVYVGSDHFNRFMVGNKWSLGQLGELYLKSLRRKISTTIMSIGTLNLLS